MPYLLAALTIIIQACFIYHVFKTRRPYWWAFIILSFPVVGCIAYYFVEVFPQSREARSATRAAKTISEKLDPGREMRRRVEEVEICGSLDNKMALAEECMRRELYEDAVRLYRNCMQGMYAEDPHLMLVLAEALVEKQDDADALGIIGGLREKQPAYKPTQAQLLLARAHEGLGQTGEALRLYEELAPVFVGLEARCRHGLLLKKLGRDKQAYSVFNDLLAHAKRHNLTHEGERHWMDIARRELRT